MATWKRNGLRWRHFARIRCKRPLRLPQFEQQFVALGLVSRQLPAKPLQSVPPPGRPPNTHHQDQGTDDQERGTPQRCSDHGEECAGYQRKDKRYRRRVRFFPFPVSVPDQIWLPSNQPRRIQLPKFVASLSGRHVQGQNGTAFSTLNPGGIALRFDPLPARRTEKSVGVRIG